jgi:hypothetical protein
MGILRRKVADRWRTQVRAHRAVDIDGLEDCFDARGKWRRWPRRWDDPAIAGVGCTGWRHHHFVERQWKNTRRIVTYDWIERGNGPAGAPLGEVVFRNGAVAIVRRTDAGERR